VLSTLPAGAEVEFSMLMTLNEFAQQEIVDNIDGQDAYRIAAKVNDAEAIYGSLVALYR
jgi:hypothetical protein